MATTITAGNATNGLVITPDNTGILELKTGTGSGTTAVTIGTTGNVNFPISGQRITGDFSNATIANRVMFQTSTVNGNTVIHAIPNGTGTIGQFIGTNNSDPTNASLAQLASLSTEVSIRSGATGTGTYLPMTFYTNGSEKLRIAADAKGTYTFGGTAPRITGDFSNATVTSRVLFQTSTTDNVSNISVIPNGTSTSAAFTAYNNSNPTDAGLIQIASLSADSRITAGRASVSGTYLPMTFYTGGSERARIDTSGNVLVTNAGGGLGYGTGAGGTVTQATNKSTAVTLNKPTGQITLNNAALAANTTVTFQLTNSVAATTDGIVLTFFNGGVGSSANYLIWGAAQSGSAIINVRNISGGSLSEAIVINFAIIKGATS